MRVTTTLGGACVLCTRTYVLTSWVQLLVRAVSAPLRLRDLSLFLGAMAKNMAQAIAKLEMKKAKLNKKMTKINRRLQSYRKRLASSASSSSSSESSESSSESEHQPAANVAELLAIADRQAAADAQQEAASGAMPAEEQAKLAKPRGRYNIPPGVCKRCWLAARDLPTAGRKHTRTAPDCEKYVGRGP